MNADRVINKINIYGFLEGLEFAQRACKLEGLQ